MPAELSTLDLPGGGRRTTARPAAPIVLLLGLSLLAAGEARAQDPAGGAPERSHWLGLGLGVAWGEMDCGRCEALPDSIPYAGGPGFHLYVAGGGTLAPGVRIGAQVSAYGRRKEQRDATVVALSAIAQYHPRALPRGFVRAGVGPSVSVLAGGGTLVEAGGFAGHLEVGYEGRGRPRLTPYAGALLASNSQGSASVHNESPFPLDPPRRPRVVYAGVGLRW